MIESKKKDLKFFKLYKTFSEKEKIEFSDFLKNEKRSGRNYNQILDSIILKKNGTVDIKGANSRVTKWNRLSELLYLAEKFITLKSFERKNSLAMYLLMKEFRKRNLNSLFENKYKEHKKNISKTSLINSDLNVINAIDKLYIDHLVFNSGAKNFKEKINDINEKKLGNILIELLEYVIDINIQDHIISVNVNYSDEEILKAFDINKILSGLSKSLHSKSSLQSVLRFLIHFYLSTKDLNDSKNIIKAEKIFFGELVSLSREKREKYYSYLISGMTDRFNIEIPGSGEDLFYIINKKLKEGFTGDLETKDLILNNFRDYIYIALKLNKIKWVKGFIKKYVSFLKPEVRHDLELFGNAQLKFKSEDFKSCIELLENAKRKNAYIFVDVSVLKLKALFELNLTDKCHDELKNFKEYLRKDRPVMDLLIVYAKEFCKAYSILLKIIHNPSEKTYNDLEFMLSQKSMIGKKWISEKLINSIPGKYKIQANKSS